MSHLSRILGSLLFAGACLTSAGCWDLLDAGPPAEPKVQPPPQPTAVLPSEPFAAHHDRCVEVFVKSEGNGFERRPRLSHRASEYPKSLEVPPHRDARPGTPPTQPTASTWLMTKAELVSLLRHEKPGVYSADGMVSAFRRPKVRDLDDFETAAVAELQKGERVKMTESPEGVRLLGAIRARQDCLKCHEDKKEGDLLGAFTYVFERVKP